LVSDALRLACLVEKRRFWLVHRLDVSNLTVKSLTEIRIKELSVLNLELNLTPDEIHLINSVLSEDGQTLEEAFMSFIQQKTETVKMSRHPKMENSHVQKNIADVDETGAVVIPEIAQDHVKDWETTTYR